MNLNFQKSIDSRFLSFFTKVKDSVWNILSLRIVFHQNKYSFTNNTNVFYYSIKIVLTDKIVRQFLNTYYNTLQYIEYIANGIVKVWCQYDWFIATFPLEQ